MEEFRSSYERIRIVHDCKVHMDVCTFNKNAKFCCGLEASKPDEAKQVESKKRGRGLTTSSMCYQILGALRGNALKRHNVQEAKKKSEEIAALAQLRPDAQRPKPPKYACYSDDDTPAQQRLKEDFMLRVYNPYWQKVRNKGQPE